MSASFIGCAEILTHAQSFKDHRDIICHHDSSHRYIELVHHADCFRSVSPLVWHDCNTIEELDTRYSCIHAS